ncbi:hypothetical protein [Paraburkholderia phenoliruptrix]|nr:hypothetical protein [Paraburkholderia phenoliruptrix]MBW9104101.1 hypothetical protein [Paraburkholderia phenoliruptrix]MBW9130688.1 hypothetical protein [Paraburkholderia ginsengiterrae]
MPVSFLSPPGVPGVPGVPALSALPGLPALSFAAAFHTFCFEISDVD